IAGRDAEGGWQESAAGPRASRKALATRFGDFLFDRSRELALTSPANTYLGRRTGCRDGMASTAARVRARRLAIRRLDLIEHRRKEHQIDERRVELCPAVLRNAEA